MPNTMRAVRFHEYGPAQQLRLEQIDRPEPDHDEVLIGVRAAGVNPIDWKLRAGYLQQFMPLALPHTPGLDVAGVVEAVGAGVTGVVVGDEIYGRGNGSYAEYAIAPASMVARKPGTITFAQAASVPIGATTAWSSLFGEANVQPGQVVLVQGAAGGVGMYAVQFAHWKGARVIATTSAKNRDFVAAIGADEVIDYTSQRFEDIARDVDTVVDTVGGDVQERSWAVLKRGGTLVSMTAPPSADDAVRHGVRVTAPDGTPTTALLEQFAQLIDGGSVRTEVSQVFTLDTAADAQERSQSGHGRGRIVLEISR